MKDLPDGSSYNGEVNRSGKQHGKGTLIWPDGSKYTGDWVDGFRHGKGTEISPNGRKYTGDWLKNQRTGKGTHTWPSGDKYTGDYVDGKQNGKGTHTWPNGNTYTGDFIDGQVIRINDEEKRKIIDDIEELVGPSPDPCCSFCGKTEDEVDRLIAGPSVFICNVCVSFCVDIIKN